MFSLKTGEETNRLDGSCIWYSEDGISFESGMGYTSISADYEVRCKLSKFLKDSATLLDNTDVDFEFQGCEYRFAISEDSEEEGPLDIYIIVGMTLIYFQLEIHTMISLSEYLVKE